MNLIDQIDDNQVQQLAFDITFGKEESPFPIVQLSSTVRVLNFGSPHSYKFTDGTELPACTPEVSKSLMLDAVEQEIDMAYWTDISLEYKLNKNILFHLEVATDLGADIILVPFPVMTALKKSPELWERYKHTVRVCRLADRVTKEIHHDRFCI